MSIFDARYDRLSEIKKKRAANSSAQSGEVKAAGVSGTVKSSPFDGYAVTSRPGKRNAPTAGASTNHAGLDRAMPRGTALKLPIDVTYYRSGSDKARGKWIEFKDAGGNILHYQHLDSYGIFKPGETVPAGSQIAVSGASGIGTGAHLHEEYWSPDGQNITESYWGGLSKGTASGALPTEYKKAGGNVFNAGTNALAREGKSALAGSYEGLSRFEKVQMLKKRRDERRGLRERAADKMSRADDAYTFGRKKDDYSVGGIINKWQENENAKALTYEKKNADTVNRAQQRLGDDNFKKAALDGLERAKRTVGRVYIKPSGRDDTTVLTSYMTDEELLTYSGLLQTEGQKSAAEYIDAIKDTLKARAFEHAQYPTKFAGTAKQLYNNPYDLPLGGQGAAFKKQLPLQKSGVTLEDLENESGKSYAKALAMGTAASFATAAALGKTGEQMIKNAVTGKYEPTDIYDPAFMPARLQRSAQEGTTRNDSQWVKFLKSAGFSIAGSLVNAAAGGPIGAGASLAMMGASAAGQSAFEGAERGLTPAQATTLGAVNGALEAATEMIPVKNIFKAFKSKSAARELAKEILQAGFENAEQEAINTLAGNIADEIITGDRSELMTSAREYAAKLQQEKGLSNEQAISEGLKKATIDAYIVEPLYSAASGAFSGAVQTGASAVAGRAAADISDTVRAYSAGQNAAAAIDKLGYKIEYTDDPGLDGKVDKGTKTVYFNREGDNIRQTVKHEISHMLENNEKYGEFRSFVKEEMPQAYKAAERRVSDRLERVNAYREERGLSKYKSDAETIEAETFAELAEVLKSDRLIRRFALGSDMPKTMRVIEFARDASARLSEKLGTDGGWSTAARKWAAALSEAQADESGVRNKIAKNEKGKYVQAERQVIKSDNPQDWESEIINYVNNVVRGGKDLEITLDNGEKLKITGRTAWKLGYRNGEKEGKPISDKYYLVKGNASGVIDEVASVSKFSNSKSAGKAHSNGFGKDGFDYRTAYFRDLDGGYYNLTLSVGKNADGKEIYNIGNIKKVPFPMRKLSTQKLKGSGKGTTDSVAQKGDTVNSNVRKSNTNDTNVRNKIAENEKGKYVQAERQVITGKDPSKWGGQVTNYINDQIRKGKDVQVIAADGDVLTITRDTAGKARFRNYVTNADGTKRPMTDSEYAVKLRAETHIDEVSAVSKRGKENVPDRKNHTFAKNGFNYRTAYFQDFDGTYYKLTISVGKNGETLTVYNVGKQKQIPQATQRSDAQKNIGRESVYTDSVAQKGNTVNSNIRKSNTNDTNTQNKIRDVEDILAGAAKKKGYDREHFNSYGDYLSNRIDRAEEKNRQLEQIRKTLEHMANVAGEVHVDALKISDYAAELKRQTASKMPRREIAARLEDIYTGIAKSDPTDDGTRAYNALFELADDMLSASDRVDRSMYEQYAPLREFLRSTPISLAKSDRADIADWRDFVNRNRGRIRISEKGTGVDAIYEQLAAEYPEFFAESGYTHPADRLKHIARVRDSLDPVYNNQRHTDDEAAILAQSMFTNYFSDENASIEHQTLLDLIRGKLERDIADKYEEKYRKEIEHHKERVEYYKNIDKKVAERAAAAEGGEKAPEYVDTDVTDEYLHKYVKDIKFGEDAGGVRILRRKYADRESVVIDFDRPTVYRDAKPGEYTMSDDPVYKDIMERVKRRQKIEENWHEGETREGTLPYDAQNIWRNMRKFFGERDYAEMKKRVLDPLDDSKRQYEYIQRFYSNIIYEKVVKELGIKMGSRLSALTQMYGEGVLTEEDLGTISEADMKKIKKADEIFRTVYDGLLDTINDSRKAIYPNAQDKVKKIEDEIAELRQEMFLIEAGYTSGDFSELDPKKWENLKQIDIRRESAEELIYRAQAAAKERVASLDGKIEQVEAELFKIGNRKDLKTYQELIDRRDRLVVRRSEIMNLTEAKVDKLKAMAQKLTNQFDENSSVYKEKLAKRLAALNRREGELIGELATDEITYGRLIQRRRDYYHHFEELADMVPEFLGYMKVHADDNVSVANRIKGYINSRGLRHNKNIDNRLAGKSADTKPKAKWQSFAQRRTQTETVNYDAVGGFKRYVAAAAYSAAIDPNISIFRALADDLAMPIDGKPSDKSMGGFIDYLRKYANELAGKSNEYGDRFVARIVGRNRWNRLNRLSSRIKSNQVVYNVSCDVAQILNVPVAIAYMRNHPAALNGAIVDTVWGVMPGKNEIKERYKYSSFLTERFSDNYTRFEALPKRTLDNIANFMLGALDEAGTKYIWNAAYRSAIAEGSKTPIRYADDVTRRMVAGRGIGELPYYQKSKLVGMLIPFTLESGNVWDAVGDMMRDSAQKHGVDTKQGLARKAAKVGAGVDFGANLLVLFVMNYLFNYIIEKIRGTDGGLFDPIADIKEGVRNNKGVLKTAGLIAGDFVGSFPVGGFAAGVYPEYGIELPGGINLPSRRAIFGDSDPTRFGTNGGVFLSAVKDPAHMLIPKAGGAQARKIGKAMYAFYNGAVRTRSGKVKYELSDKSLYNIIRGLTFGTSALTETEDYYNQKEVNFHGVPDGFEYKHKSREVTIGYDKVELRGDDLEQYETLRLARYKRLAQNNNTAFNLRNPYGTPEKGWSAEKKKQYEADRDRMKTVLVGLYEQGSITKDRLREIYSAYKNGGDIRVRGVEYYAPTKVKREKKYSELTEYQRSDFKKKLDRDVKSGKLAVEDKEEYARMIRNKEWDFIATVDEYLTGDIKDLSKEEKKKVYSQINSLSTDLERAARQLVR